MRNTFYSLLANNQTREADQFLDWIDWDDGEFMATDTVNQETLDRKWQEWKHTIKTNT